MPGIDRRELLRRVILVPAVPWLALGRSRGGNRTTGRPPNVVLFLIDDLGWMDLGCQGSSFYETPRIDRVARDGIRFTQAYSGAPVCSPSRVALLTGRCPGSVGFTGHITATGKHRYKEHGRIIPPDDYLYLPYRETTLAEALQSKGYVSASIGKWHLGPEDYFPEKQGFDTNIGGYEQGSPPTYFDPYASPSSRWNPRILNLPPRKTGEYLTDRLTDEAIRFMKHNRERPFFLYMTHYAVHTPLEAPEPLIRKYEEKLKKDNSQISAVYAAMVERVDDSLGRIIDALDQLDLRQDTVIIVTSDNGGMKRATRNKPLREGKGYLYEGGIRVPLIISWAGRIEPGQICAEPVAGVDVYPTVTELAGASAGPGPLDGRSLTSLLFQRGGWPAERNLYWYYPHYNAQSEQPGAAIRQGRYKLIERYDPPAVELYDLEADISETRDLSATEPGKTAELRERLQRWIETNVKIKHRLNPKYDPALAASESAQ
jgi:arylsulfatase A